MFWEWHFCPADKHNGMSTELFRSLSKVMLNKRRWCGDNWTCPAGVLSSPFSASLLAGGFRKQQSSFGPSQQPGSPQNYCLLSVWLPLGGRNAQKEREDMKRGQIPWEFPLSSAPQKGWDCVGSGHCKAGWRKARDCEERGWCGTPLWCPHSSPSLPPGPGHRQLKRWMNWWFLQPLHSSRCFAGASCRRWGPAQLCHRFLPEGALSRDRALLRGRRRCSSASAPSGWVTQNSFSWQLPGTAALWAWAQVIKCANLPSLCCSLWWYLTKINP